MKRRRDLLAEVAAPARAIVRLCDQLEEHRDVLRDIGALLETSRTPTIQEVRELVLYLLGPVARMTAAQRKVVGESLIAGRLGEVSAQYADECMRRSE